MADIGEVEVTAVDLTRQASAGVGQKIVMMGYASGGTASGLSSVARAEQLVAAIGNGLLTEIAAPVIRKGGAQLVYRLAGSGGTISTVSQSGSGPALTATGTPRGSFTVKVKITRGGTTDSGAARFRYALNGTTYTTEEYDIPARRAAELVGTVDMTTLTLSTLNTKHFTCTTEDTNAADVTMTTPASVAALITALNSGIVADSSNAVVQSALRAGKYLVVKSGALGASSTITAASGDGMDELGLNGQSDTGEDSTFEIHGTGITITFASGTHEIDTVHTFTTTAPKASLAAFEAAIDAIRERAGEFSAIAICQEWADEYEAYTYITALAAKLEAWQTSEPYAARGLFVGMPLGSAGDANIQTNDNAVRTRFNGWYSPVTWWAHGDCYASGVAWPGQHRRTALVAELVQAVSLDESQSIGERLAGAIGEIAMTAPDGATAARDETTALTKMSDRWTVLIKYGGAPYALTGRTAAQTSGFQELAWIRPFYHAMQVAHDRLWLQLETTYPLEPNGRLRAADQKSINDDVNAQFAIEILNPPGARQRASSCVFTYTSANNFGTSKAHVGRVTFQALGIAHSASVTAELTTEVDV